MQAAILTSASLRKTRTMNGRGPADRLRANSGLNSSEHYMPVLGVIFLRHATNRYNAALQQIEEEQASIKVWPSATRGASPQQ